ncbi:MAG TPA: amidohydrolase family protein, partial [Blastocatellia bacterium]|nr:amidohydrolase family protein [Blastocatellia bacterium]
SNAVSLVRIIEMLTIGPARAFSLAAGTLAPGTAADVTVFDPDREWTVDPHLFKSKSRNTPFAGWQLRGAIAATFVAGRQML